MHRQTKDKNFFRRNVISVENKFSSSTLATFLRLFHFGKRRYSNENFCSLDTPFSIPLFCFTDRFLPILRRDRALTREFLSTREDYITSQSFRTNEEKDNYYAELKTAAESGWDFSSRWFILDGTNKGKRNLFCRLFATVERWIEMSKWNGSNRSNAHGVVCCQKVFSRFF